MLSKKTRSNQESFFYSLPYTLSQQHPLYILAGKIQWQRFEESFAPLYCRNNGRPGKPIRLMVGLLLLKHLRNVSDESIVEQWSENVYYQYFCGEEHFCAHAPCEASELVHFRHRIGVKGMELIFQESIRINGDDSHDPDVSVDTTVQEKNITFPTDRKLHRRIIARCLLIASKEGITLRQSYRQILKKVLSMLRFKRGSHHGKAIRQAERCLKTIAGRLTRELDRKLDPESPKRVSVELFLSILMQKKGDKNKIYSVHEPEVCCISKGKEYKRYEFGNKVSLVVTQSTGVIVGATSFRNEYDGHTLQRALEESMRFRGYAIKTATVDRGYKGQTKIGETEIRIPQRSNYKSMTAHQKKKMKRSFQRRAAIEPLIGHLKSDHRLSKNYYKGITGDSINVLLAASAFNLKRMMNKWKTILLSFLNTLSSCLPYTPVEITLFNRTPIFYKNTVNPF